MNPLPWWAKLESRKILTKAEQKRRSQKKKAPQKKRKFKTPTQHLMFLCETYGLSTHGNTQEMIDRLLDFLALIVVEYTKAGASDCFGKHYRESLCQECVLQRECEIIFRDIQKIRVLRIKYLIKKRRKK